MVAVQTQGGASAPSNIIALPKPRKGKGRTRARRSLQGAGVLSLRLLDKQGVPVPANVVRIDQPDGPDLSLPERSPALLLAISVYSTLPLDKREDVRQLISHLAFDGDPSAAKVLNLLRGGC